MKFQMKCVRNFMYISPVYLLNAWSVSLSFHVNIFCRMSECHILLVKPLKCLSVMNKNGFIIENKAIPFKFTWEEEHL